MTISDYWDSLAFGVHWKPHPLEFSETGLRNWLAHFPPGTPEFFHPDNCGHTKPPECVMPNVWPKSILYFKIWFKSHLHNTFLSLPKPKWALLLCLRLAIMKRTALSIVVTSTPLCFYHITSFTPFTPPSQAVGTSLSSVFACLWCVSPHRMDSSWGWGPSSSAHYRAPRSLHCA